MNRPLLALYLFVLALLVPCCKCRTAYNNTEGKNYKQLTDVPTTLQKIQEHIIVLQAKMDSSTTSLNTLYAKLDLQKSKCSADIQVLAEQLFYYNKEINDLKAHIASTKLTSVSAEKDREFPNQKSHKSKRSVFKSEANNHVMSRRENRISVNGNSESKQIELDLDFQKHIIQSNFETIQAIKNKVESQEQDIIMLKNRMELLQAKVDEQPPKAPTIYNSTGQANVNHQQNLIQENKDKIERIKDKVKEQDKKITLLQSGHSRLLEQVDKQEGNISTLSEGTAGNTKEISELESQLTSTKQLTLKNTHTTSRISSKRIVFRARLSTTLHSVKGLKVRYNEIDMNSGVGYNTTGEFTCTVPGIYVFYQSFQNSQTGKKITISINKNGQVLAWNSVSSKDAHPDAGTTTAVTRLGVGDKVWTEIYTSSPCTHLEQGTTFSGYLLFSDE